MRYPYVLETQDGALARKAFDSHGVGAIARVTDTAFIIFRGPEDARGHPSSVHVDRPHPKR